MRRFFILLIGVLPFSAFRIFCYKNILGYKINNKSHIGWLNYIDCLECLITDAKIGFLNYIKTERLVMSANASILYANRFKYLFSLKLEDGSKIRSSNVIIGFNQKENPYKEYSSFELGKNSLLVAHHYMDATDTIKIGENVVFGGIHTKVWTHGFDVWRTQVQAPVHIHDNVYIGAGVSILQGVEIASETIIGASTVVSKSIMKGGFYISNQLVKKSNCQSYGDREGVVKSGKANYYRKMIE